MNRALSLIVFFVIALVGVWLSLSMQSASIARRDAELTVLVNEAADRTVERLSTHATLLQATDAMFDATAGAINHGALTRFVNRLETDTRHAGIHGIGFALLIRSGQEARARRLISRTYDLNPEVAPKTDASWRAPIVYLEPRNPRNLAALGHDLYSDPSVRLAMAEALASAKPRASGPVTLPQESSTDKQRGFLMVMPVFGVRAPDADNSASLPAAGFVFAPFRTGELFAATLWGGHPPMEMRVYDKQDPGTPLFATEGFPPAGARRVAQTVDVAGRSWVFEGAFVEPEGFQMGTGPLTVLLGSLLVAFTLAYAVDARIKALAVMREIQTVSQQALMEKDLMLQEMKHRIKNSIARILAIARQTASTSGSLGEFESSFFARLQAMAAAQDVLTRSHWMRADLRALLDKELQQVFGDSLTAARIDGPEVELAERAAQAFGLIFHELATNALKYGHICEADSALAIAWRLSGPANRRILHFTWAETSASPIAEPETNGFGTRLIRASIQGELGGTWERTFVDGGVRIVITAPLQGPG
jgi:two-component sensor histidine kinase